MARLRPIRSWQHPKAPVRLIARQGRQAIARPMRDALRHLPGLMDRDRAVTLARSGRFRDIVGTVDWHHFRQILRPAFERMQRVFEAGAHLGVRKINGVFAAKQRRVRFRKNETPGEEVRGLSQTDLTRGEADTLAECFQAVNGIWKALGDRFNFDRMDDATVAKLRDYQDQLIQQLEQDARDTIDVAVRDAIAQGLDPADIVDQVRSVINLTDRQAQAVLNYRSMLENLDGDALRRQLRDDQYDAAVQSAIDNDVALEAAAIDEMVSAYEDNYLNYRATTIADTESVRAANLGLQDAYRQAVDRGALPDDAVRQFWQVSVDEATCPICLTIPDLNPDGVGIDEEFDSDDGPQDGPPVHPNCRCGIEVVTDLDKVPDEGMDEEAA